MVRSLAQGDYYAVALSDQQPVDSGDPLSSIDWLRERPVQDRSGREGNIELADHDVEVTALSDLSAR
jgi:hypothetical protein